MESIIMDGIPIPLLPYSLINQDKLIMVLDKVQTVIPEEIQQADQILAHKDEIQAEAQRRAQQLMMDAKQQADNMLNESDLLKAVHLEAERIRHQVTAELESLREQTLREVDEIRQKATEEARLVRESADEYADMVLKTLNKNLDEFQVVARSAQKQLKKNRVDMLQAQYPESAVKSSGFGKSKESPKKRMPDMLIERYETERLETPV